MSGVIQKYHVSKNLWNGSIEQGTITGQGADSSASNRVRSAGYTTLTEGTYTLSYITPQTSVVYLFLYDENNNFIRRIPTDWASPPYAFTLNNAYKIRFAIKYPNETNITPSDVSNIMLNTGSTALPYEPFETENLFDVDSVMIGKAWNLDSNTARAVSIISISPNTTYTIKANSLNVDQLFICEKVNYSDTVAISNTRRNITSTSPLTFTTTNTSGYLAVQFNKAEISLSDCKDCDVMLNVGSTPLPYTPYGTIWKDVPYTRLEIATDTLSALPVTTYNDGTNATVAIKGDMVQSGTPTPTSPITPSECGERTKNLFDKSTMQVNAYLQNGDGVYLASSGNSFSCLVKVKPNTSYRVRVISKTFRISFFSHKPQQGSIPTAFYYNDQNTYGTWALIKTSGSEDKYMVLFCYNASIEYTDGKTVDEIMSTVMISEDAEMAVPFEPYGYKLPIISGNTTTNVYLSEPLRKIGDYADTIAADGTVTRVIKKIVLTGEERWQNDFGTSLFGTVISATITGITALATNYTYNPIQSGLNAGLSNDEFALQTFSSTTGLYIKDESYTTVETWKTWLQTQYAAGTPVTIWYVLETPTTETITAPSIPTTTGGQTFDVDTTLKPSEVDLTYHGWHEHEAEKYSRTENLWDENMSDISSSMTYKPLYVGNNTVTMSSNIPQTSQGYANLFLKRGRADSGATTGDNGVWNGNPRTFDPIDGYVTVAYRNANGVNPQDYNIMLNTGSTAKPYQPYLDWE